MKSAEDIRRYFQKSTLSTNRDRHEAIFEKIQRAQDQSKTRTPASCRLNLRSSIMKSRITKLAVAAAIITAVVLSINMWDKSIPSAYAIEQTIEANNNVRYLHIKIYTADEKEPREGWLEFDRDGQVTKARIHLPAWFFPVDGARVIVWREDIEQVWDKSKKVLGTMKANENTKEQLTAFSRKVDPRLAVKHICELESQGKVEVEIAEPSDKTEPITMTVTYSLDSSTPNQRKVLHIDPVTKLVSRIVLYQLKDGEYQYDGAIELDEYSQSTNAQMFDLQNEVPSDVTYFDQTANDVGLAQGQLSDEEIAAEVVRQFFEALIAEDYARAGKLFILTIPASEIQKQFGRVKILSIVSIGPAIPNPELETKGFAVPCTIELEENGQRKTPKLEGIKVQHLHNQPERWAISSMD
jgi:hypothetical protein